MKCYNDLAIVIAWPEIPTRGDERWMKLLKRIGIVKNLHFKVGHAAIVLVNSLSGELAYYDFGRYVTARGYGRARSAQSDPRLGLSTKARVEQNGHIANLRLIIEEMHLKREATHGYGIMYFSIADNISFDQASSYAEKMVKNGPIKYGAIASNCNSCSRYVAQILLAGLQPGHPNRRSLLYPESIKASPMSNVVNATSLGKIYTFDGNKLSASVMSRLQSLNYQARLIAESLSRSKTATFPPDHVIGQTQKPIRHVSVPEQAQWLGGIGEGAWYDIKPAIENNMRCLVSRYGTDGKLVYMATYQSDSVWKTNIPYQLTHHTEYRFVTLVQQGAYIRLALVAPEDKFNSSQSFAI